MSTRPYGDLRIPWRFAGLLILASVWPAASAWGQTSPSPAPPPPTLAAGVQATAQQVPPPPAPPQQAAGDSKTMVDPNVVQAGCATCTGGILSAASPPTNGYDGMNGGMPGPGGCDCAGGCVPGRKRCYCDCCDGGDTCVGRMLCGLYHCVCCPDPCYEPCWCALQDSAFFVDAARPQTQLRLRIDGGFDVPTPDRAEFFMPRFRTMPNQAEPGPTNPKDPNYNCFKHGFGKGPSCIPSDFDYEDFSFYMEGGTQTASFFIEMPYREIDPETSAVSVMSTPVTGKSVNGTPVFKTVTAPASDIINTPLAPGTPLAHNVRVGQGGATVTPPPGTLGSTPTDNRSFAPGTVLRAGSTFKGQLTVGPGAVYVFQNKITTPPGSILMPAYCCNESGFSDMNIGTKAVLLDCELLLLTLQFKTYLPTGNFTVGLGNGHVSLEPALLFALKLTPDCYLQGEFAYWIPVGGDPLYEGDIYHSAFSLNKTLWCPCPGLRLVGTLEAEHWQVLGGDFTATDFLVTRPNPQFTKGNGQPRFITSPVALSATTGMLSAGPGIRLFICDKIDIGVGTQFALTEDHWATELVQAEFRWRF
jgi:hypothetical protein